MSLKEASISTKKTSAHQLESVRTRTLIESVGLLRAVVIGGALFISLSLPLMFNIQTRKETSEITNMRLKMNVVKTKIRTVKDSISLLMETHFPNSNLIEINGKKFYIRSK